MDSAGVLAAGAGEADDARLVRVLVVDVEAAADLEDLDFFFLMPDGLEPLSLRPPPMAEE